MTNFSIDISGKVERSIVDTVAALQKSAAKLAIPFFLVGASARDIVFSIMFEIPAGRATLDVDFATRVPSWEQLQALISDLLASGAFVQDRKLRHRFKFMDRVVLDIIPFDGLERPTGEVRWPSDDSVMSTLGFKEAFEYSLLVRMNANPDIVVKVCNPPGLAILKLVAWHEKYPQRKNDAQDLLFIMNHYIDAGNTDRLHGKDKDLMSEDHFDYGLASPRLLGRDIAKIANATTLKRLIDIVTVDTDTSGNYRLVHDMLTGVFDIGGEMDHTVVLLKQLHLGFQDQIHRNSDPDPME